ncbi:alpha/beta fold hydrolase [Lactococcus protaetiae]|uniref:Alpha/beta hydrolase n=1 Tax=Lactococcus protaetiae TaxID=2592653 RepID=A0A514Z9C3_9LACT|nr:alpha/beta hydrolase [Lactococcus protaetiae]QDK71192.1 alpha/beta hydrolase [Lactococcus protaetiae]
MNEGRTMIFQVNNLKLHYEVLGKGKPLVILHGLAGNLETMEAVFEPVFNEKSGFQRLYVDLPGMGKTNAPLEFASSDAILEVLLSFVKEVVGSPFLLAGYSYGGYLARAMAVKDAAVNGLLLLAPVIVPEHDKRALPETDWFYETQICKMAQVRYDAVSKQANEDFLEKLDDKYALSWDVSAAHRYSQPALILLGQQDGTVGFENQLSLILDYPRATVAILDLAGHNLQMEQREVFEELVKNWIERCEMTEVN